MTTSSVTCPLCEATCGLTITHDGEQVSAVRGDELDVLSQGFICPKGASLAALHEDPDRLTAPLLKRNGEFVEVTWDEAFAEIARRLPPLIEESGRNAVAVYAGNPGAHNLASLLYGRVLYKTLGTHNICTAGSVDQLPKHLSSGYLFGDPLTIPVPDVDRTSCLLVLGANPLVSNGSLMTAPDMRGRLRALRKRGGRLIVVDPRRTATAQVADLHLAARPGTDAFLLAAVAQVLFAEGLVELGALAEHVVGVEAVADLVASFTPEAVADVVGLEATSIRDLARELAGAESAAVYGRIGTSAQEFGTLTSWLVDVVNVLTGNLDRPGGAMFPLAAAGQTNAAPTDPDRPRKPFRHGRWTTRVRGLPEVMGEVPVAGLAEEITTPGEGRVRALITVGGNPCLSTPNAGQLDAALDRLDFMISLDVYLNETSRHADVILPGPSPLARPHYDVVFYQLAVRNVANWTPATLPTTVPQEWRTLLRLAGVVGGAGPDADVDAFDDLVAADVAGRAGVDLDDVGDRRGPERLVDIMLRSGPYGLTLADLEAAPHGVDLGPLQPRLPEILATASGKVELAPPALTADVDRLRERLAAHPEPDPEGDGFLLIGRRHLSSNNSWMHNLTPLVRGSNRCTAQVHPDDARRLGLLDGHDVEVRSRVGSLVVPAEITDVVRPGVISIPHGWGHDAVGTRGAVAAAHAGVNSNVLTDDRLFDAPSGTAVLNGIPVRVCTVPVPVDVPADVPVDVPADVPADVPDEYQETAVSAG